MRSIRLLGVVLVALLAAAAQAGTLTSATWLQVTQGVPMSKTTTQLGATGTSTAGSISVNVTYPQFTNSIFVPIQATSVLNRHIRVTQGGPQAITATPAMAGADQGVPGTVIWMTALHVAMGVNQSMFNDGHFTSLKVPISVGQAGQFTQRWSFLGFSHTTTVDFFAWTPGMVTFTGLTRNSVGLATVMAVGSFNLNGNGAGTVTLVSPSKISIDGSQTQQRTASFATLKLTFVPEPGTLLLLGAAVAALVLARRR